MNSMFHVPKPKKQHRAEKKPPRAEEDELGLDEDFKNMDLFNDNGFDEEEEDF